MNSTITAYLGIGSNSGDREQNLTEAVIRLTEVNGITMQHQSHCFESEPFGMIDQEDFLNAAVEITTTLDPEVLLGALKKIENDMGRETDQEWGPRNIDIDILYYGELIVVSTDLVIPHPLACERVFVLRPMLQLNPELVHPVFEKTIRKIYHERESELNLYHCLER